MSLRRPLAAVALILLACPLRAAEFEIKVTGIEASPKGLGTTKAPLRLSPTGTDAISQLPAGVDVKTYDAAADAAQPGASLVAPTVGIAGPVAAENAGSYGLSSAILSPEISAPQEGVSPAGARTELGHAAAPSPGEKGGAATSTERLSGAARVVFDGEKDDTAQASGAVPRTFLDRWFHSAGGALGRATGRALPRHLADRLTKPVTLSNADEYGGPKSLKLDLRGKLNYGAKWALNMVGLGALIQYASLAFEKIFSWQLHVSNGFLESTGRVELLTRLGPKAINAALTKSPFQFLFVQLPAATAWEEFGARVIGFGVLWTILAAIRPAANAVARWLENVPDLFDLRSAAQGVLLFSAKISRWAFPVAATISAFNFAASHFAAWGASPYFASVHFALGFSLAYIAYKTRSLLVPIVAHYFYNLLTLAGGLLAVHFLLPGAAQLYTQLLGVAGIVFLYFNFRSHQKARAQAKAQSRLDGLLARSGKAVLPLMLAAVISGSMLGPGSLVRRDESHNQALAAHAARVWPAQGAAQDATKAEEKPAPADTAKPEEKPAPAKVTLDGAIDMMTESVIAKTKPAVVKIFSGHGLGSGYIISAEGIVISNAHVTGEAKPGDILKMEFSDGSEGKVKVLAANHNKDIAILQLPKNEEGWPFIPLGDSGKTAEGQTVLAMGYPLGLPFTVTRGIISGLGGNRGNIYVQQLQTDAAINHGNSGGALINMRGEVIGMNTAIAAPTAESGSIGIGFSIVSEDIKAALAQFAAAGNINTAWMGIIVQYRDPFAPDAGVLVEKVRKESPAAKAGLQDGDIILGVDKRMFGKGPHGLELLARTIARHKPGEKLVLLVGRQGDVTPLTVALADEKQ